jgi:hypothetical protein
LDFHEDVVAGPENLQARGNIPWGKNYQPFGAGDFEECMDGYSDKFFLLNLSKYDKRSNE